MQLWPSRAIFSLNVAILLHVLLLSGCSALTEPPTPPAPLTYPKDAYETAPPRKAAYVAECQRLGGRIVSRICYTEGAGGPVLIHIPESFDKD
ncbi:MAG: hypothetical protein A3I00_08255 [Betaproteobacteria bacterium RIFCSPLOWO2_02_FULL_64_12]|nr:MAG: hypothetical protein A3I00_08255 [Betaproteobacteria bacterium RIFCSPLOWO2_02_FULL_64_12]